MADDAEKNSKKKRDAEKRAKKRSSDKKRSDRDGNTGKTFEKKIDDLYGRRD